MLWCSQLQCSYHKQSGAYGDPRFEVISKFHLKSLSLYLTFCPLHYPFTIKKPRNYAQQEKTFGITYYTQAYSHSLLLGTLVITSCQSGTLTIFCCCNTWILYGSCGGWVNRHNQNNTWMKWNKISSLGAPPTDKSAEKKEQRQRRQVCIRCCPAYSCVWMQEWVSSLGKKSVIVSYLPHW